MFSSTSEYALRSVVFLATNTGEARTAQQIALVTHVPAGYISKVLHGLVRAGLVLSQRGPTGGFTLARSPTELSVLDVINAVDPIKRIRACPLGIASHGKSLCKLHRRLDDTMGAVEQTLAASTIAELMEPTPAGTRCLFPTVRGRPAKGTDK